VGKLTSQLVNYLVNSLGAICQKNVRCFPLWLPKH